jgi:hypothetical protein
LSFTLIFSPEPRSKRMRFSVRLAALAALSTAVSPIATLAQSSAVQCRSGTLADYIALGAAGCRAGEVLLYGFRDVSFTMTAPLVGAPLTAADILVDPIAWLKAADPIYQYSGVNFRLTRSVPGALGTQSASASFLFGVAGIQSLLYATEGEMRTPGQVNPTEHLNNVALVGTPGARVTSYSGVVGNRSYANDEVTPEWTAAFPRRDATFLLNLSVSTANQLNTPRIAGQEMRFMVTAPEPSTWALFGTGLLTLGGIAARRRKRAQGEVDSAPFSS